MSIIGSELLFGAADEGGVEVERSLRFNSADSAHLSRTFSVAGNRQKWTWSGWVKLSSQDNVSLFSGHVSASTYLYVGFNFTGLSLYGIVSGTPNIEVTAAPILRDFSAWYHVVVAVDTTQATAANRVKLYINGVEPSYSVTTYPSQNYSTYINNNIAHYTGANSSTTNLFNGYLTDVHFVDGQALTPSSFGVFDTNNMWQPATYTGSYGTNGFHLTFSNNSTVAALGTDTSGNGNTWTVNNLSVTPGAGNDSLVDSPTDYGIDTGAGGGVRGNYCTFNPLRLGTSQTLSNGNLDLAGVGNGITLGTIHVSSGKWYYEAQGGTTSIGIATNACPTTYGTISTNIYYHYNTGGQKFDGSTSSSYGASFGAGDIIGVAFDLDAGTITFYKNGVSQGTAFTGISGSFAPAVLTNESTARSYNFGQRPFTYTAPSGHKALCTANLPEPTILDGSAYMDVVLDSGSNILTAAQGSLGGNADLLIIKDRVNSSTQFQFLDTVRGGNLVLKSPTKGAETTYSAPSGNSVAWTWDSGTSTVTNTAGTITSTVRANPAVGVSVLTYTGVGSTRTIGHGLNAAPTFMIVGARSTISPYWAVYHGEAVGPTAALLLNTQSFPITSTGYWNNTAPTSTVFTVGNASDTNFNGYTYVAYCFAPVEGFSQFGYYYGNGNSNGPFVHTGFKPKLVIFKSKGPTGTGNDHWIIKDSLRAAPYNPATGNLYFNLSFGEDTANTVHVDLLSNGFKIRGLYSALNYSNNLIAYAAFAENPFKYARAV